MLNLIVSLFIDLSYSFSFHTREDTGAIEADHCVDLYLFEPITQIGCVFFFQITIKQIKNYEH